MFALLLIYAGHFDNEAKTNRGEKFSFYNPIRSIAKDGQILTDIIRKFNLVK